MLFDEHGGKDNGESQAVGQDPGELPVERTDSGMRRTDHDGQRIINVDAGRQIGGRIAAVNELDQPCKYVIPGHHFRSEEVDVGEDDRNGQEQSHAKHQQRGYSPVTFFIGEQYKNCKCQYIHEPEHIGDDENLTERNGVIQGHMNDRVMQAVPLLHKDEYAAVADHEEDHGERCPQLLRQQKG